MLDKGLSYCWEELSARKVTQKAFIASHIPCLAMFAAKADWQAIHDAAPDYVKVPHEIGRVMATIIGAAMFIQAKVDVMKELFKQRVQTDLEEVSKQDFAPDVIDEFKDSMVAEANALLAAGAKSYEPLSDELLWMQKPCQITVTCPNDLWEFPMMGVFKMTGLANGQLKKLPHETILYPNDIPGARSTARIPDSYLAKADSARSQILTWLGPAKRTIHDMGKVVAHHAKEIYKLDRFAEYEVYLRKSYWNCKRVFMQIYYDMICDRFETKHLYLIKTSYSLDRRA